MKKTLKETRWLPLADLCMDNDDAKAFLSGNSFSKILDTEKNPDEADPETAMEDAPESESKTTKKSKKDEKAKSGKKLKKSDYKIKDHEMSLVNTTDLNPHLVEEARFYNFIPKKTLGSAIQEVRDNLIQIERVINRQIKLKNESGLQSGDYWKRTHKALSTIEERMTRISNKIKQIKG